MPGNLICHQTSTRAGFLLPRGFPDSVTDDYVTYQLWAFPCHIFVRSRRRLATDSGLWCCYKVATRHGSPCTMIQAVASALQGWMSHSLATSSLLQAVGVHPGAAGTAGATAAVKWITKDGIGAFGRLLVRRA